MRIDCIVQLIKNKRVMNNELHVGMSLAEGAVVPSAAAVSSDRESFPALVKNPPKPDVHTFFIFTEVILN